MPISGGVRVREPPFRPDLFSHHAGLRRGPSGARNRRLEPAAVLYSERAEDRNDSPFVDILINACKGGGGGTQGADGYDHVGLIASGGALGAQDPEMFELMVPSSSGSLNTCRTPAAQESGAADWVSSRSSNSRPPASRRASSGTAIQRNRPRQGSTKGCLARLPYRIHLSGR